MERPSILIVDDTESARVTVEAQLAGSNYEIEFADGAVQARTSVAGRMPDLVLLDVMMPGTNGIELCREWRADPRFELTPIVLITALDSRDDVTRGLEAGASEFLTKPTHAAELRARIANLLDARRYHELIAKQHEEALKEIDRLRDLLLRMDRLATLGTFAAGVGHELNNISTVLVMCTNLALKQIDADVPVARQDIETLAAAVKHVAEHGKAIMRLGAPATTEPARQVDVCATAESVAQMLRVAGRTKALDLHIHQAAETLHVHWHPVQLEQVLINLCANAADACAGQEERGRIDIRVAHASPGWVRITVADNGPGMPPEVAERVYEPYFTTKPAGSGTGLGLPVIKQLVESAGGEVSLTTMVGKGTTVVMTLPEHGEA